MKDRWMIDRCQDRKVIASNLLQTSNYKLIINKYIDIFPSYFLCISFIFPDLAAGAFFSV